MKFFSVGVFVVLVIVILFSLIKKTPFLEYKINNKIYKLLVAKTQTEWEKGLMFYKDKKELKGADGMMFIFPSKNNQSFWNENTYLDLDVYWLSDDRIIGKSYLPNIIKTKEPFIINSPGQVNKVVEIIRDSSLRSE